MSSSSHGTGKVYFAKPADDIVILRVVGRGNLELSPTLKNLTDHLNRYDYSPLYVVDLGECPTLDSTFMGTIASLGLHQQSCGRGSTTVVNANPTTHRQLTMLGLNYLLDIRCSDETEETEAPPAPKDAQAPKITNIDTDQQDYTLVEETGQSRFERIVHMIESHEALIDACSGNEIKFRAVLETLNESLGVDDRSGDSDGQHR